MVAQNLLQFDPAQHGIAKSLENLLLELRSYQTKMQEYHVSVHDFRSFVVPRETCERRLRVQTWNAPRSSNAFVCL